MRVRGIFKALFEELVAVYYNNDIVKKIFFAVV